MTMTNPKFDDYRAAVSAVSQKFRHIPGLLLMEGGYDNHHTPALRVDIKFDDRRRPEGYAWSDTKWFRPTTSAADLERFLIQHVSTVAGGRGHLAAAASSILHQLRQPSGVDLSPRPAPSKPTGGMGGM
jgi:hypothetical protein